MIIKGIAQWAQLKEPNPMSGKYQLDLINLSADDVAKIEAAGATVKRADKSNPKKAHYGAYVTLKSNRPVQVYDAAKKPVDVNVGNGSEVTASVNPFEWNFKGKKGVSLGLRALKVTKLVEFGGAATSELFEDQADSEDLPF